jgi:hypothetical protein
MNNKTKEEKKSALKLINKYAESYSILEEENKQLKGEVNDLRLNLKINKEIIDSFYSGKGKADINYLFQKKMKEEHNNYNECIDKLKKEKDDLRYRLQIVEQTFNENITQISSENEKLKSKLFILDNCIIKKDNIIQSLKKKLESPYEDVREREVPITDPTELSLRFNNELSMYKELYNRLIGCIRELKIGLYKSDRRVQDMLYENNKLNHELRTHLNVRYENEKEKQKEGTTAATTTSNNNIDGGNSNNTGGEGGKSINQDNERITQLMAPIAIDFKKLENHTQPKTSNKKEKDPPIVPYKRKYFEYEEWWLDALRQSCMDANDYKFFVMENRYPRVVELLEVLNDIILDRNYTIKLFEKEIALVNEKCDILERENISLYQQIKGIANMNTKDTGNESSMIINNNNASNTFNILNGIIYEPSLISVTSSELRSGIGMSHDKKPVYVENESYLLDNVDISISMR